MLRWTQHDVLNAKMCSVAMDAQLMVMPNAQAWSFECKDVLRWTRHKVLNAKMCRVAMDAQLMVMPNA